jgi:hypothetical protein
VIFGVVADHIGAADAIAIAGIADLVFAALLAWDWARGTPDRKIGGDRRPDQGHCADSVISRDCASYVVVLG